MMLRRIVGITGQSLPALLTGRKSSSETYHSVSYRMATVKMQGVRWRLYLCSQKEFSNGVSPFGNEKNKAAIVS
jgi:hypothetical protein